MGEAGLKKVASTLGDVFAKIPVAQGFIHTTRAGLISYASNATVIGDLRNYYNLHDFMADLTSIKPSKEAEANILDALKNADVVRKSVTQNETRKIVIVIVASAYDRTYDPSSIASQLKDTGVKILTLALVSKDEGEEVQKISDLASPGFSFNFKGDQSTLPGEIQQAFCRANCFCPIYWVQVTDDFHKPTAQYAECVQFSSVSLNWFAALMVCRDLVNGKAFLASERSDAKHKFHADYIRSIKGKVQRYFIGLSWDDASQQYFWDERNIPLNASVVYWASGNGSPQMLEDDAVLVAPLGLETYWYDVSQLGKICAYMCQVDACDTDNYCDDSVSDE
ncbi:von Willebrand factor [Aphelenchoides avenae]|nr:von Willebrand factor [Aphelenchus avenae]